MRIDRIKLITEMAKRNMTQKELAELAGISRVSVSAIKNGKSCSNDIGIKIAEALHMPIEKLLEK